MTEAWDVVGSVGGMVGGVAGVVALWFARRADKRSKDSGTQAERSLELAEKANVLSTESNSLAVDAKHLAEEANTISQRRETRETERHDVHWEIERVDAGKYRVVNAGEDEAHRVVVVFHVDDEEARGEAELVHGGEGLSFDMPGARKTLSDEVAEYRTRRESQRNAGMAFAMPMQPGIDFSYHVVAARITWETRLGSPRSKELHEPMSTLHDWD